MRDFATLALGESLSAVAPDGANVRVLLALRGGSFEEIWFVLSGGGEMWRKQGGREEIVALEPGVCLTIPLGTHFQFRAGESEPLAAVAIALPPWPGEAEAVAVAGPWSEAQLAAASVGARRSPGGRSGP